MIHTINISLAKKFFVTAIEYWIIYFFLVLTLRHFLTDDSVWTGFPARQIWILVSEQIRNRGYCCSLHSYEEWISCTFPFKIKFASRRHGFGSFPNPLPPSPVSKLDWRRTGRLRKRDNLLPGGGGGGEGAKSWMMRMMVLYKSFNNLWLLP